VNIVVKS